MNERVDPAGRKNNLQLSDQVALAALNRAPFSLVLTNPALDDNPLVYVNQAFEKVTGFSTSAVIGRNCRLLQGGERDTRAADKLRKAIDAREEVSVTIRNVRADGEVFRNRLMVAPLYTEEGELLYFLGIQMRVPDEDDAEEYDESLDRALKEIQHRVKNHLSMIVGMIRLQARKTQAKSEFDTLARRVEALQLLYEELGEGSRANENNAEISLGAYLSRVANAIAHLDGRRGVRVNVDADAITVPFEPATRIGLVLSEIMTNALQHAFTDRDAGLLTIRAKALSQNVLRLEVVDDGIGIPADVDWPDEGGLGGRIVKELVRGLDGTLSVNRQLAGTAVVLDIPRSTTELI